MLFTRKTSKMKLAQDIRPLDPHALDLVAGGRLVGNGDSIVIIGCTTQPPLGGYPRGTKTWNPWIGQPHP